MLKDLGNIVETKTADRIKALLDKYGNENDPSCNTNTPIHSIIYQDDDNVDDPGSPLFIDLLENAGRVEEDFNRSENSRATGLIGNVSEVFWMRRLQ
ncbi:unnamed protein product [Penicillium pancosmium]